MNIHTGMETGIDLIQHPHTECGCAWDNGVFLFDSQMRITALIRATGRARFRVIWWNGNSCRYCHVSEI